MANGQPPPEFLEWLFSGDGRAAVAGALGGVVRWITLREHWTDGLASLLVGAILMIVSDPEVAGQFAYLFTAPALPLGAAWAKVSSAYAALAVGALGSPAALAATTREAAPLICAGLGVGLGFRAGLFNIGAQGQAIVGAILAGQCQREWRTESVGHGGAQQELAVVIREELKDLVPEILRHQERHPAEALERARRVIGGSQGQSGHAQRRCPSTGGVHEAVQSGGAQRDARHRHQLLGLLSGESQVREAQLSYLLLQPQPL